MLEKFIVLSVLFAFAGMGLACILHMIVQYAVRHIADKQSYRR